MFNFERLEVWQRAVKFNNDIYEVTGKFPKEETFGITSQLCRASISVALNIAESAGRKSKKEFGHFLSMSYGSICECVTLLKISLKRNYLSKPEHDVLYEESEETAKMLSNLSKL